MSQENLSDISFEERNQNEGLVAENSVINNSEIKSSNENDGCTEDMSPSEIIEETVTEMERNSNGEMQSVDEITILDPNHPLMIRFQKQLFEHLTKQREKYELESATLKDQLNKSKDKREEIGVRLYERQQELASLQAQLEDLMEQLSEKSLTNERTLYEIEEHRKIANKLRDTSTEESKEENPSGELDLSIQNIGNIESELKEIFLVEQDVIHMQANIEKLNAIVCSKKAKEEELFNDTILQEKDFIKKLKVV
ncbi:coiled-coil domain-containing protein 40-like [Octopus sinensis]|uniref:Coiled-coil domain-containing protein 40-like n=1 Tax=Octopus sinensis TaxID=2607531 RepID=A0A6P7TSC3_9MOLL|nr:coiled-coil domain-containing protein 40-like [Octopus sinensis]